MKKNPPGFTIIDHTADLGIEAYGKTLNQLFENSACGMFILITDINKVKDSKTVKIKLQRYDYESDKSLSKFYDIELESVEQAKKVAQAVEREYKFFTGEKIKEEDKPFVLPWRKDKIEVTKEEHKQMDKVSKKQKKLKSTPKS